MVKLAKYRPDVKVEGEILGVRAVQNHGRVQIPAIVREKLELKDGDRVYWIEKNTLIILMKSKTV